ncbi:MAG: hypothetical protein RSA23_09655 [Carnobacterium sp.]
MLSQDEILKISKHIPNGNYNNNMEATEQLITLLDSVLSRTCKTWKEYVKVYDDSFYTYETFEALVHSEEEQSDGLTIDECVEELNQRIWKLPCGWYVQCV